MCMVDTANSECQFSSPGLIRGLIWGPIWIFNVKPVSQPFYYIHVVMNYISNKFWNFMKILKFFKLKKKLKFFEILTFFENFEILWNFLKVLKFYENFKFFWNFKIFWYFWNFEFKFYLFYIPPQSSTNTKLSSCFEHRGLMIGHQDDLRLFVPPQTPPRWSKTIRTTTNPTKMN
jgi:hypothetical protein